jgi:hypothetical protein
MEVLFLSVASKIGMNNFALGYYGLITSLSVVYIWKMPSTSGILFLNEKRALVVLLFYWLYSTNFAYLYQFICGILTSLALQVVVGVDKLRIPQVLVEFSRSYLLPLIESRASTGPQILSRHQCSRNISNPQRIDSSQRANSLQRVMSPPAVVPPPQRLTENDIPSDRIRTLMELGFDREACVRALIQTNGSLEEASNILLE